MTCPSFDYFSFTDLQAAHISRHIIMDYEKPESVREHASAGFFMETWTSIEEREAMHKIKRARGITVPFYCRRCTQSFSVGEDPMHQQENAFAF
jgi:hypothetical protein